MDQVILELVDFFSHNLDVACHLVSPVAQFLKSQLQGRPLFLSLLVHLLSLSNSYHLHLILLVKVCDQLVLSLEHSLVLLKHLVCLLNLLVVV